MVMSGETIMTGANKGEFGKRGYSELKVMESSAGYYLGTDYTSIDHILMNAYPSPGSRETHYFNLISEAESALEDWKQGKHTGIR